MRMLNQNFIWKINLFKISSKKELILNRDERERNGGAKEKEKEKNKAREERTRESGGRSRGSR